jgi:hypothetical protein
VLALLARSVAHPTTGRGMILQMVLVCLLGGALAQSCMLASCMCSVCAPEGL